MSTGSWSFIAAGVLIVLAVVGFGIGSLLSKPSSKDSSHEEGEE